MILECDCLSGEGGRKVQAWARWTEALCISWAWETKLGDLGFGYRAKYIQKSSAGRKLCCSWLSGGVSKRGKSWRMKRMCRIRSKRRNKLSTWCFYYIDRHVFFFTFITSNKIAASPPRACPGSRWTDAFGLYRLKHENGLTKTSFRLFSDLLMPPDTAITLESRWPLGSSMLSCAVCFMISLVTRRS